MSKTENAPTAAAAGLVAPTPDQAKSLTKLATVLTFLKREQGATLAEMIEATGWQAHTTRATLTGFRKKGLVVDRGKRGDVTCYYFGVADA